MHHLQWRQQLIENDQYYFDEVAANRAVKFIESYLRHYETPFEGMPFILLDFQRDIVRDIYGWKRKDNHLRRFREVYFEIPKGNGKSPLMAAIGMYMLLAEGTAGAYVLSAATGFQQAKVTFDAAKRFVEGHPKLLDMCGIPLERRINAPKNSAWEIISGTPEGKAGPRPTCAIFDEAHEWPNRRMYAAVSKNTKKRPNSLILVSTNSGTRKDSVCWELHEKAQKVLDGVSNDETLYPVIYGSDEKEDPFDPQLWKRVNPALDTIITTETLRSDSIKAKENPFEEAEFRRLNCGQWCGGADSLIDMARWDACTRKVSMDEVQGMPLVVSLDMSLVDDLSALTYQWIGVDSVFVKSRFWLPRQTAQDYESKDAIPYTQWEREGHITLLDSVTMDHRAHARIAKFVMKLRDKYDLRCVVYDRNYASHVVKLLEAEGIACVAVPQNWALSPAIEDLMRRLKDKSIIIHPSPILRWNASNVRGRMDQRGNLHMEKEGANGKYAGRRGSKHDGLSALVTGLSQVRLEQMQPAKKKSVYESRGLFVL